MSTLKSRRKLSFFWLDCTNENFFRIVIPSGMARSHRMLLLDSRDNVNSERAGFAGSSTIAPLAKFAPAWKRREQVWAPSVLPDTLPTRRARPRKERRRSTQFDP